MHNMRQHGTAAGSCVLSSVPNIRAGSKCHLLSRPMTRCGVAMPSARPLTVHGIAVLHRAARCATRFDLLTSAGYLAQKQWLLSAKLECVQGSFLAALSNAAESVFATVFWLLQSLASTIAFRRPFDNQHWTNCFCKSKRVYSEILPQNQSCIERQQTSVTCQCACRTAAPNASRNCCSNSRAPPGRASRSRHHRHALQLGVVRLVISPQSDPLPPQLPTFRGLVAPATSRPLLAHSMSSCHPPDLHSRQGSLVASGA